MDTSNLLGTAIDILRPHIKELSFKEFKHCLKDFSDDIDQYTCHFRFWSGAHLQVPYDFCDENVMMYPVALSRFVMKKRSEIESVRYRRLLLRKLHVGGVDLSWYFQETEFHPISRKEKYFDVTRSSITYIDDLIFRKFFSSQSRFEDLFWDQIRIWIESSRQSRMAALASLQNLEKKLPQKAMASPTG